MCEEGWPQGEQERESRQDFSCPCVSPLCYQMGPNNLIQSEKIEIGDKRLPHNWKRVKLLQTNGFHFPGAARMEKTEEKETCISDC